MHLANFLPSRLAARAGFIRRCLKDQSLVEQVLDNQPFYAQCTAEQTDLKSHFHNRLKLRSLSLDEGTMLFDVELNLLKELVERSNSLPGPIIEIGTLFGYTTSRIALWRSPQKKIITVDNYCWNPWQLTPDMHHAMTCRFLHYLEASGQVEVKRMDKDEFFKSYRGEAPALVFLDADHSYEATKADIEWARNVGAKIISGHDYFAHCPGVGRAVEEAGGAIRHAGGVWALKNAYWQSSAKAA
ncbi:MAG TPA: class I SAM-dependent methyltransferase [Pirellulales bacterium]|nr:class I SAM-dependent methyltransferase [Pirellulales bacterium]